MDVSPLGTVKSSVLCGTVKSSVLCSTEQIRICSKAKLGTIFLRLERMEYHYTAWLTVVWHKSFTHQSAKDVRFNSTFTLVSVLSGQFPP